MIKIYTDSSFNEKYRVAGIGVVIQNGPDKKVLNNSIKVSNNNIGEMCAIWYALNIARRYSGPIEIYTDSQTAINYINGFTPKNKELTLEQKINRLELKKWAYRINKIKPDDCQIIHVKAHTGKYSDHAINNAIADLAAKNGFFHYMQNIAASAAMNKKHIEK